VATQVLNFSSQGSIYLGRIVHASTYFRSYGRRYLGRSGHTSAYFSSQGRRYILGEVVTQVLTAEVMVGDIWE
jgi:hypothetical protein